MIPTDVPTESGPRRSSPAPREVAALATDAARRPIVAAEVTLRVGAAGLSVAMGAIHLVLWQDGVRHASIVGPLFLLNVAGGFALAAAVLISPRRLLAGAASLNGLFNAGTLVALFIAIGHGLFGFHASWQAPHIASAIAVEAAGIAVSALLVLLTHNRFRRSTSAAVQRTAAPVR